MLRRFAVLWALAGAVAALAGPSAQAQTTEQCLADHAGDAPVLLRGRLAAERTITATDLRTAAAAGTLTARTQSVTYLSGSTPNKRTYAGVSLYEAMTKLVEPLFGTTVRNIGLPYFLAVSAVDSYRVLVAWGDIEPFFGNRQDILLAYDERNDDVVGSDFVSLAGVGPRLIVPGDVRGGRYVSCIRDIRLASTDDTDGALPGPASPTGPVGPEGPAGPTVQASPGVQGPAGPAGAKGDRGATGRDGKVTCRLTGKRKTRVRCTVTYRGRNARLTRDGRVYARGTAQALRATRMITKGRYTLRVGSRRIPIAIR